MAGLFFFLKDRSDVVVQYGSEAGFSGVLNLEQKGIRFCHFFLLLLFICCFSFDN